MFLRVFFITIVGLFLQTSPALASTTPACTNNAITDAAALRAAISSLPSSGGTIYIPGGMTCNLGIETVNITAGGSHPITIEGDYFSSVIKGIGNPVLATTPNFSSEIYIHNFRLITGSTNDGMWINKNNEGERDSSVENMIFEKDNTSGSCNGTLLKMIGTSFASVLSNYFYTEDCPRSSNLVWAGNVIGLWLDASTQQYTQNMLVGYNTFEYMNMPFKSTTGWGPANAGHSIRNNNIWDTNYYMDFNATTDASDNTAVEDNNFDSGWLGGIDADNVIGFRLKNNFIAVGGDPNTVAGPALLIKASNSLEANHAIVDNQFRRWNDKKGTGGDLIEIYANSNNILSPVIENNHIDGNANSRYGIYIHGNPGLVAWASVRNNEVSWFDTALKIDDHVASTEIVGLVGNSKASNPIKMIDDAGFNNLHHSWRADNLFNEEWGRITSFDGATVVFPHGMATTPSSVSVTPTSQGAAVPFWVQTDPTNIIVHFTSPPRGAVQLDWRAIAN